MGADHRAQQVVGGVYVGHPVADGLVDGVLKGAGALGYRAHLGAEELHAEDIGGLAADVLLAHVDDAFHAQHGAHGGGSHPVLAGAGLGDDALLAHAPGEQPLPQGVVYLVGAGVGQVLPLEQDSCPAYLFGELLGRVEGGGAPDELPAQSLEPLLEAGVVAGVGVGALQLVQGGHQHLRDEPPAVVPEVASLIGQWFIFCCHPPSLPLL